MPSPAIDELVEYFLGLLVTAGDYALAIQPRIGGPAQKDGHNAWVSALTDADLSVQNFIEVATLARLPGPVLLRRGARAVAQPEVLSGRCGDLRALDPINATFLYKNQRPRWDIIVSIAERRRLMAAISYVPSSGRFYLAIRDRGALSGERRHARLADLVPLHTRPGSRQCLTYETPELRDRLRGDFECYDFVTDDDPARGLDNLNEFYSGRLAAFACRAGECLDWGAAAFIATQAGGKASHLDGSPLGIFEDFDPQETVDMIVAADPATHAAIMSRLT